MALLRSAFAVSVFTLAASVTAYAADKIKPVATEWKVSKNFKGNDARENLSGAACATKAPPFTSCLIVNDEEKYAQFFSITDTTLVPGEVILLRSKDVDGDPDGEGAAYEDGFFYVTGSHGRARNNKAKSSVPSYVVFRVAVNKATGKPAEISEDKVTGVEASTRLHDAIHDGDSLRPYFNAFLDQNGTNIEGIAVKGGRMYLGFRGPSVDKNAFILSVDAKNVFTKDKPLDAKVHKLNLGNETGIRDMAAVDGGILILSGPVNDQNVIPSVFFWDELTGDPKLLAQLEIPEKLKTSKAETLLILRDEKGEPFRALVMFDGFENGGPTEYLVPR